MPVNSMTGHGRGDSSFKGTKVIIELNSVNHRQFDLRLEMPPYLSYLETEIRQMLHSAIMRGSVLLRCHVVPGAQMAARQVVVDHDLVKQYLQISGQIAGKYGIKNDFGIDALFSIPGVIRIIPAKFHETGLKGMVLSGCRLALKQLCAMRKHEGDLLARDLIRRIRRLEQMLTKIERRRPAVARQYKTKIKSLLQTVAGKTGDRKMLREIIMMAERGDIAEEIERSRSHIVQFKGFFTKEEPVGRTMDFLAQEMMREINTIGAKSNDCFISNLVVNYKSELENIREQARNIE